MTTGSAGSITAVSVVLPGAISATGCTAISAYGIEYSMTSNFTNGTGTDVSASNLSGGNYSISLGNLSPNTTYYYKAYATNAGGTTYGSQQSFTTSVLPAPVATTATSIQSGSFNANWNAVTGATSYKIDV